LYIFIVFSNTSGCLALSCFISLSSWVEGLLTLGCYPSLYVTLCILHVPHTLQGSAKQTVFPFCLLLTGFQTQRSLEQSLPPFHYRLLEWTCTVQFMMDGFELPVTEG